MRTSRRRHCSASRSLWNVAAGSQVFIRRMTISCSRIRAAPVAGRWRRLARRRKRARAGGGRASYPHLIGSPGRPILCIRGLPCVISCGRSPQSSRGPGGFLFQASGTVDRSERCSGLRTPTPPPTPPTGFAAAPAITRRGLFRGQCNRASTASARGRCAGRQATAGPSTSPCASAQ
jgi:hypothetical protein